jgi:protein O-GlcNAc transferase
MGSRKPKIRILRHLARTGGTLITKCLGSMDGVVALSEVHPGNLAVTNPMMQAVEWFGLVDLKQVSKWKRMGGPTMLQFVGMCETRASGRGEALVLRDWSHLDYYGVPYVHAKMGTGLRDSLMGAYDVVEACTTRHPVDQYVSLGKIGAIASAGGVDWELFLDGGLAFAQYANDCGFVRYEDLTRDPDGELGKLCAMLEIEFDPGYAERWGSYVHVTGDTNRSGSEGTRVNEIRPLERKGVDEGLLERLRGDERYVEICGLLGYDL